MSSLFRRLARAYGDLANELAALQIEGLSAEQRAVVRDFVGYAIRRDLTDGDYNEELAEVWQLSADELQISTDEEEEDTTR